MSRDLVWWLVHEWKLQSWGVLNMFRASLRDFLAGGPSSREKHLDKFFQFLSQGFWRLGLTTCSWLIFSHENCVFCDLRIVKKKKKSFPSFILTVHCLVRSSLSQTHCVSHKNPPIFFIISTSNFKKRYRSSIFLKAFHVYNLWFLDLWVVVEIWKMWCLNMGWVYFVEFVEWLLLILILWWLFYMFSCLLLIF